MHLSHFRAFFALAVSACLGACAGVVKTSDSHVEKVTVTLGSQVTSTTLAGAIESEVGKEAALYGRNGAPKELRINVVNVKYKAPGESRIPGQIDRADARVELIDMGNGSSNGGFDTSIVGLDYAPIVDAMVAAKSDPNGSDRSIGRAFALTILERVFGTQAMIGTSMTPEVARAKPMGANAP